MIVETKYNIGDTVYIVSEYEIRELIVKSFRVEVNKEEVATIRYNVVSNKIDFDLFENRIFKSRAVAERELDIQLSEGLEKDAKLLLKSWDEKYFELARELVENPNDEKLTATKNTLRGCIANITEIINKNK